MTERLEATVHGRVQGVGFRWFVVQQASRRGLTGWTSNEPDGSVRVVAEGSPDAIDAFAKALAAGPPAAVVDRVDQSRAPATGEFGSFGVRHGAHRGD